MSYNGSNRSQQKLPSSGPEVLTSLKCKVSSDGCYILVFILINIHLFFSAKYIQIFGYFFAMFLHSKYVQIFEFTKSNAQLHMGHMPKELHPM